MIFLYYFGKIRTAEAIRGRKIQIITTAHLLLLQKKTNHLHSNVNNHPLS